MASCDIKAAKKWAKMRITARKFRPEWGQSACERPSKRPDMVAIFKGKNQSVTLIKLAKNWNWNKNFVEEFTVFNFDDLFIKLSLMPVNGANVSWAEFSTLSSYFWPDNHFMEQELCWRSGGLSIFRLLIHSITIFD